MQYTRVLIAKVALRVATEDEVFWVEKCIKQGCGCEEEIRNLRKLAELPRSQFCMGDDATLIKIADSNRMSQFEQGHLMACERCARLGQYIANMANPATTVEVKPMELAAG
jgi:hypothetical protein